MEMTAETAYNRLANKCARAECCAADLMKSMQRWGIEPREQAQIVARLMREGFIDESRFAHAFVRDKFRFSHWGAVRIRQELRLRQIADSVIDDALTEIEEGDNLAELRRLIEQKRRSTKAQSDYELRGKLIRYALGRGFSYSDISKVIDCDDIEPGESD